MSDRVKAVAPPDGRTMMTTESVARKTQKSETEAPREPAPVSDEKQTDVAKTVARLRKTLPAGVPAASSGASSSCARYRS